MKFVVNDGGRAAAGFKDRTGDCVTRAIAIATGLPYREVYKGLNRAARNERPRCGSKRSSARTGIKKPTIRRYLESLGWQWTPTMHIGSGCKVHLREDELPSGRLIVSVSKHLVAVIDGVIHDVDNPDRDGTRCVYGYWTQKTKAKSCQRCKGKTSWVCRTCGSECCEHTCTNKKPDGSATCSACWREKTTLGKLKTKVETAIAEMQERIELIEDEDL